MKKHVVSLVLVGHLGIVWSGFASTTDCEPDYGLLSEDAEVILSGQIVKVTAVTLEPCPPPTAVPCKSEVSGTGEQFDELRKSVCLNRQEGRCGNVLRVVVKVERYKRGSGRKTVRVYIGPSNTLVIPCGGQPPPKIDIQGHHATMYLSREKGRLWTLNGLGGIDAY